jgi:predicted ribosome quality control (RQC) complex YloA/Tae2 family protein
MGFREITLTSGAIVSSGKDAKSNDELMEKFKGKPNVIMHTVSPGSPFCVINNLKPSRKDISASGAICATYSQDWRDNKGDVKVNVFTGKDISKRKSMKVGTWKVNKCKVIKIKKRKIKKWKK